MPKQPNPPPPAASDITDDLQVLCRAILAAALLARSGHRSPQSIREEVDRYLEVLR
jgi:hypothetical protein